MSRLGRVRRVSSLGSRSRSRAGVRLRAMSQCRALQDRTLRTSVVLCSVVLVLAGIHVASAIMAPMAFALVMIATVWPIQSALQSRMPKLLALIITTIVVLAIVASLIYLLAWAF